ncbi:MAG: hypothetical protein ACPGNV_17855 [Mangrovicoccus sp.]
MAAFWNVIVGHAFTLFGTGGGLLLLGAYLYFNRNDASASGGSNRVEARGGGEAVGGNKIINRNTGLGPAHLALILGAIVLIVGLMGLFSGGGHVAISGSGPAIIGNGNEVNQ